MAPHLRVFSVSDDDAFDSTTPGSVRVCLGDLLPLLALAKRNNYQWLQDFLEDEVQISADLYEVMRAFRYSRRPSA